MPKDVKKKIIIEVTDNGTLKSTSKDAQTLNRNIKGVSRQSSNASKNFSKTAQGMQGVLVPAYAEVAARVFALSAAFHALSEAANYNILVQGQQAFAKMTGKNMARIAKSVQVASKHMLDFKEASTSVALASTSGISSKQIVAMTKAAVDSSSALGRSVQDTMDRLTRGIVKAEPEILDEIGVIIRLDRVYKDYADSVSKSTAELTESEKATARYNAIMGQLESKFGGIADNLDPNYFAALSATVLDIIRDVTGFGVKHLAGPLKFLTQSKLVLVAIMALIGKSLIGKIFPAFKTFGDKISGMPGKMQTRVDSLKKGIGKLKNEIKGSRVELEKFNKMTKGGRMTKGMEQARSAGDIGRYAKLESAAIKRAQKSLGPGGKGTVKGGIYKGLNASALNVLEKQVERLGETSTRFNTKRQIEMKKHGLSLKGLQLGYANLKLGMAKFGQQQMQLLNMGFFEGVKQLGKNWKKAGAQAGMFGKIATAALNTVRLGISSVTVAIAAMGRALNAAFKYFVWITMIGSMVKAIVSLWHDFDTKFAKASEAAGTLNTELKNILDGLEDRPITINFEGVAKNFADALKNAEFAANLADEIYTATHKAMKHLGKELAGMNWFDQLLEKIKEVLNLKTIEDKMREVIKTSIKLAKIQGTALPKGVQNAIDKEEKRKKRRRPTELTKDQILDLALERLDIGELTKLAGEFEKIQEETGKVTAKHAANVKELGQAYAKAGKVQKEYKESLISKSVFYDLAKAQQSLQNLLDDTDITPLEKMTAAIGASYIKIKEGSDLYKAIEDRKAAEKLMDTMGMGLKEQYTEAAKEEQKKHILTLIKKEAELTADMYDKTMKAEDYLGWNAKVAHQNQLTAIKEKIGLERQSTNLKIFGNTALKEQSVIQRALLLNEVKIIEDKIEIGNLDKDALAIAEEQLKVKRDEVRRVGALALKQAEHRAKVEGRTLSIIEKYTAMRRDLVTSEATSQEFKVLERKEREDIHTFFTKYTEGLDKSIKLTRLLTEWTRNFGKASKQQQADAIKAQKKALRFSSYAGMDLSPGRRNAIIKDSDGVKLATSHRKLSREMEFKKEDRAYRKHKVLLDLEFKLEKIKYKNISEAEKFLQSKWAVEMELMKAQEAVRDAIWKDRAATFGAAMNKVAQSFGSAVGNYFNDIFMNKEPEEGAFRNTLAQGFAGAGSGMIAGAAQKQVFGNKGFIANMMREIPGMSGEWIDTLFPQTELELAKERTNYLKKILEELKGEGEGKGKTYGMTWNRGANEGDAGDAEGQALHNLLNNTLAKQLAVSLEPLKLSLTTKLEDLRTQSIVNTTKICTAILNDSTGLILHSSDADKKSFELGSGLEGLNSMFKPSSKSSNHKDEISFLERIAKSTEATGENTRDFGGFMNSLGSASETGKQLYGALAGYNFSGSPAHMQKGPKTKDIVANLLTQIVVGAFGLAKGGVVSGGFRAFANGGVANKPTLGMIGEGKYNEAVVPLPDGKSIPVVGAGGNNNVTVNVAIDSDGKSKAEVSGGGNAKELGYLVSQAVQSELVEQQRPGGLLSAY